MRNLVLLLSVLTALSATLAQGQKAKDEAWPELLPPGAGREVVLNSCNSSCHNLRVVVDVRKSRADWTKSVNDMIQRGAPVFPEEIEPSISYLSRVFGTAVPKLVNVNIASRDDLEKLPNLKPEIVTRILEARGKAGPFKNSEELRRRLGMEKKDFETILYLLKYSN